MLSSKPMQNPGLGCYLRPCHYPWAVLHPSSALALRRAKDELTPYLGKLGELTLVFVGCGTQESTPSPEPHLGSIVELACGHRRAGRLSYSATTQAQIQGFELICPNIYPICELPGPVLQIQSCRNSTAQGNSRISNRSSSEDAGLIADVKGLEPGQRLT